MVRGRSRYLDGSEAKVKEVPLEHSTSFDTGVSAGANNTRTFVNQRSRRSVAVAGGISAIIRVKCGELLHNATVCFVSGAAIEELGFTKTFYDLFVHLLDDVSVSFGHRFLGFAHLHQ